MAQYIPGDKSWSEAFQSIGKGASEGYQNRADEMAIQNAIGGLAPNASPRDVINAITGAKTYNPQAKQNATQNYLGTAKFEQLQQKYDEKRDKEQAKEQKEVAEKEQERQQTRNLANQLNVSDEKKKELGESGSPKLVEDLYKKQVEEETKPSVFETKIREKLADDYIKTVNEELPRIQATKDNINRIEELSKSIGWTGPAKALFGTSDAKELDTLSFTLLDPIIKVFNPVGAIPIRKIDLLKDMYHIKAIDTPWQREGKIRTLKRFNNQAEDRAKKRLALIDKYNGRPPNNVLSSFDKDSETLTDAMLDVEIRPPEEEEKGPEGKVKVTSKATGKQGWVTPYEGMEAKYDRG